MPMKFSLAFLFVFWLSACDMNAQLLANIDPQQHAVNAPIELAVAQSPQNLDPRYASDAASERVNRLLYQALVNFDAAAKPVPQLASWQWLDAKHLRFTLKADRASFHHGSTLTSADVKATYESLQTLGNSPHAAEFANIHAIRIVDARRLDFVLKQPDPNFVEKLIIGILPKDLIMKKHDFASQPVGNGPLKFVRWQQKLLLQRVKDQQSIVVAEVKDPTVRVLKLLRGEVDLLQGDLPPELVKFLQQQNHLQVVTGKGANFSYLGFNYQDPLLQKQKVRQAIAHAVDVPAIINSMMVTGTTQAGAILPPQHYAGNAALTPYAYQPALAKQLLIQAGVSLPLKLEYKTSTDAQRVRLATIMQAQMHQAGIELTIKSLDWGTFFENVKQGQFQLYGLTWVGIKTPDIYAKVFHSQAIPPNGLNRGRFADAEIDALLVKRDWLAATEAIHQSLPYLPLWYEGQFVAAQKNININLPAADGNWDQLARVKRVTLKSDAQPLP